MQMWPKNHLPFLPETKQFMKKKTLRDQFIKCRVTPEERDYLHELMKKTRHRSEASFIRDAVFKTKPIVIRTGSKTDEEIRKKVTEIEGEINRIGNNFNQLVRRLNTASIEQLTALEKAQDTFSAIITLVEKVSSDLRDYLNNPNQRL